MPAILLLRFDFAAFVVVVIGGTGADTVCAIPLFYFVQGGVFEVET